MEVRIVDDLVGRKTTSDNVQVKDLCQALLIGEQSVEIPLTQSTEGLVGRR